MGSVYEYSVDIAFKGTGYNLSVAGNEGATPDGTLAVDLEELSTGKMWHGEFTAPYVENITQKTGSFKKFGVFVKMLLGALKQQSDTVFLDLLTFADLEELKAKKVGKTDAEPISTAPANTKRYLILTYVVEYDRVHYPLPLLFEDAPTIPALQRLSVRLRRELAAWKELAGMPTGQAAALSTLAERGPQGEVLKAAMTASLSSLRREVSILRLQAGDGKSSTPSDAMLALHNQLTASEHSLDTLRAASRGEVKRLRAEVAALTAAHEEAKARVLSAEAKSMSHNKDAGWRESEVVAQLRETNEQLRLKVQQLTRQLSLGTAASASTTPSSKVTAASAPRGRTAARVDLSSKGHPYATGPNGGPARSLSRGSSVGSRGSKGSAGSGASGPARRVPAPAAATKPSTSSRMSSSRAAPVSVPRRSGSVGSSSRNSTPGRSSIGQGGLNNSRSALSVNTSRQSGGSGPMMTSSSPLAGLSPVTARIYSNGPRPGSRKPVSPGAGGATARSAHSAADLSTGAIGKSYANSVEPLLAGLSSERQRGLNRLHQTTAAKETTQAGVKRMAASPTPVGRESPLSRAQVVTVAPPALPQPARTAVLASSQVDTSYTSQHRLNSSSASLTLPLPAAPATHGGAPTAADGPAKSLAGNVKSKYDATAEIDDIDARLVQLQDILKAAKAGHMPDVSGLAAAHAARALRQ